MLMKRGYAGLGPVALPAMHGVLCLASTCGVPHLHTKDFKGCGNPARQDQTVKLVAWHLNVALDCCLCISQECLIVFGSGSVDLLVVTGIMLQICDILMLAAFNQFNLQAQRY